jgi:hypothetical protein
MSETFILQRRKFSTNKSTFREMMNKAALLLKSDIPTEFKTKAILASAERLQLKVKRFMN